jgi:hypothetical protein
MIINLNLIKKHMSFGRTNLLIELLHQPTDTDNFFKFIKEKSSKYLCLFIYTCCGGKKIKIKIKK